MIYYVEDDASIRNLVVYTLTMTGFPAKGYERSAPFWEDMHRERADLILLDLMLPGENGLSILRDLKTRPDTMGIPVILITAKDGEDDVVDGLELGADDYIAKPFGMAELVARVRARLRRRGVKGAVNRFEAGDLVLDHRAHTVTVGGEKVALTLKEYDLLHYLMENRGTAFSREQLLNRIWDYSYEGGSRTVDVHIQTLRAKLGRCGEMIETVRGVGYRFGGK